MNSYRLESIFAGSQGKSPRIEVEPAGSIDGDVVVDLNSNIGKLPVLNPNFNGVI